MRDGPTGATTHGFDDEGLTALLLAVGDENAAAFDRLYALTSAKLFGICLRICSDKRLAEDVLQDVYLTIWKRAGGYDPLRGRAFVWMATIARNRSIDRRRAGRLRSDAPIEGLPEPVDPTPLASERLERSDEAARLHACLDRLTDDQRGAIRTAFFDGLSYRELAERGGQPLGTVKSWIRRGLQSLKACLDGR